MLGTDSGGKVRPVLIDFGLSKHYNADGSATSSVNIMGCSDGYAPIEQYAGALLTALGGDFAAHVAMLCQN